MHQVLWKKSQKPSIYFQPWGRCTLWIFLKLPIELTIERPKSPIQSHEGKLIMICLMCAVRWYVFFAGYLTCRGRVTPPLCVSRSRKVLGDTSKHRWWTTHPALKMLFKDGSPHLKRTADLKIIQILRLGILFIFQTLHNLVSYCSEVMIWRICLPWTTSKSSTLNQASNVEKENKKENVSGNGKSPFLIGDTSSNCCFPIVILVFRGVCQMKMMFQCQKSNSPWFGLRLRLVFVLAFQLLQGDRIRGDQEQEKEPIEFHRNPNYWSSLI